MALSTMMKVNLGWAVCITVGVTSFIVAKHYVVKNRHEMMMARRRLDERVKAEKEQELAEKNKNKL